MPVCVGMQHTHIVWRTPGVMVVWGYDDTRGSTGAERIYWMGNSNFFLRPSSLSLRLKLPRTAPPLRAGGMADWQGKERKKTSDPSPSEPSSVAGWARNVRLQLPQYRTQISPFSARMAITHAPRPRRPPWLAGEDGWAKHPQLINKS